MRGSSLAFGSTFQAVEQHVVRPRSWQEPLTFEGFKKGLCRRGQRGRKTRAGDRPGLRGLLEDFILMKNKCWVASLMGPRIHTS